jgi:hypothetical protein
MRTKWVILLLISNTKFHSSIENPARVDKKYAFVKKILQTELKYDFEDPGRSCFVNVLL